MQGLCSISAHLWAPKKVRVRQPILILSPFVWVPPRMQAPLAIVAGNRLRGAMPLNKSTTYHPPPPLLQYFLLLHLYLKVISAMRRPFQSIYVGAGAPPPPLADPLTPPPPPRRESGTEAGRSRRMAHCPDPPGGKMGKDGETWGRKKGAER